MSRSRKTMCANAPRSYVNRSDQAKAAFAKLFEPKSAPPQGDRNHVFDEGPMPDLSAETGKLAHLLHAPERTGRVIDCRRRIRTNA